MSRHLALIPGPRAVHHRRGLTLMELLIVAAVIAILTGMVWSTMNLMRKSANQVACLNNLQQCALIFTAYANDNRGRLPRTPGFDNNPDAIHNASASLITTMNSYFANWRSWNCPTVGNLAAVNDVVANSNSTIRTCFSYWPGAVSDTGATICPTQFKQMEPRNLVMQDLIYYGNTDGIWRVNHSAGGSKWTPYANNPSLTSYRGGTPRGMNALFGDLRGKWLAYQDGTTTRELYRYVSETSSIFTTPGPSESLP